MISNLNKIEKDYLIAMIHDDMVEFPDGCEIINVEQRNQLLEKIDW